MLNLRAACAFVCTVLVVPGCGGDKKSKGEGGEDAHVAAKVPGKQSPMTNKRPADVPKTAVARPRRAEHAVYSLIDNRLHGHLHRGGGLFVSGNTAGFAKYMRFGRSKEPFKLKHDVNGLRTARMSGKVSGIRVPLTAEQAKGPVYVKVHTDKAQTLGLRLNGKSGGANEPVAQLAVGWNTVKLEPKPGLLVAGENDLLFFARSSPAAFRYIQIGGTEPGEGVDDYFDGKALVLPEGGGYTFYAMPPKGAELTAEVEDRTCSVFVVATAEDGTKVEGTLLGKGTGVDLAKVEGMPVRIDMTAQGCKRAYLSKAAITRPGMELMQRPGPAPKHIVLWIMDSLRADKVRLFNPKARPETPVFDELGKTSAVFLQAYSQGNETKASHASIWTSLYPVMHRMIPPNSKVDTKWLTIDEVAKNAGMFTSGVSGNGYIVPRRGFGTKWDKYRNHIHDGGGLKAENILSFGLKSLVGKEKQPWLLYLGSIDTHVSWRKKEPWFSKYDPKPYSGRFKVQASGQDIGNAAVGKLKVSARDIERIRALYDSNVSYQDQQLGVLLAKLDELGIRKDTMIIVTADHGDELFEIGGKVGHGGTLRESVVHVPLLIHYPPQIKARRVPQGVGIVDILPTVAESLQQKPDERWQGMSLIGLSFGAPSSGGGYPAMSWASKYENAHVGRIGHYKLRASGGKSKFYDLSSKAGETADVKAKHPIARRMVADAFWIMRTWDKEWRKSKWGNPANVKAAFAADVD